MPNGNTFGDLEIGGEHPRYAQEGALHVGVTCDECQLVHYGLQQGTSCNTYFCIKRIFVLS